VQVSSIKHFKLYSRYYYGWYFSATIVQSQVLYSYCIFCIYQQHRFISIFEKLRKRWFCVVLPNSTVFVYAQYEDHAHRDVPLATFLLYSILEVSKK